MDVGTTILVVLMVGSGLLGYLVGRRSFDDRDQGWMPPERRRWRP